jgi:hypothetical protein
MFGSFFPGLGWLAPPKSIRAWEPTLLWNQLHSRPFNVRYGLFSSVMVGYNPPYPRMTWLTPPLLWFEIVVLILVC